MLYIYKDRIKAACLIPILTTYNCDGSGRGHMFKSYYYHQKSSIEFIFVTCCYYRRRLMYFY